MNLSQLKSRVSFSNGYHSGRSAGYGHFVIHITYRGKEYSCRSNNTVAYDRITSENFAINTYSRLNGYTLYEAYMSLYTECLSKNELGKFSRV